MTHKNLLVRLGLPTSATAKEIDTAYSASKSELEERIQSAPTAALKQKYDTPLK